MDRAKRTEKRYGTSTRNACARGRSMELKPSEAEEFGYVLKGAIRIIRGTKSYLVKSGESFYLKGLKRHHIEAYGVKEAVFIWVSTPPNF